MARGLKMRMIDFDPYFKAENAKRSSIEKVELDELLLLAGFIISHMPLTDATCIIISAAALNKIRVAGDRYPLRWRPGHYSNAC